MTVTPARCAVCSAQKEVDRTSALAVVFAAMQAAVEGDSNGAASLYEHLSPLDAHMAVAVASDLLLQLCEWGGLNPLEAIRAYRANLASYVARQ